MYKAWMLMFAAVILSDINNVKAQLAIGAQGITIKSGTTLATEGLVLQPSANLTMDNLLVEKLAIATTVGTDNSINRVYSFSRAITFNGTLGLFYQPSELNGNTQALLALYHKNQFADNIYRNLAGGTADVSGKYVSQNFGSLTFSHITAANGETTLPVKLISYTAKAEGNHALLQWQTANESNNKGFEVYRSGDDGVFVKIGNVSDVETDNYPSQINTAPNRRTIVHFYTDKNPLVGNNYYKLVQVDNDGKATDLGVRTVTFHLQPSTLNLFPNPTTDLITVTFTAGTYHQLQVIDVNGKVLQRMAINPTESSKQLLLGTYPVATYLIKLSGHQTTATKMVIRK